MSIFKQITSASLALCLLAGASVTMAGNDSGLYVGGSIGRASLDADAVDTSSFNLDEDDNAFKVMLGYNFGLIPLLDLGVELAYRDLGEFDANVGPTVLSADADAIDLFGVAALTFGLFDIFAKAGFVNWDVDAVVDDISNSESGTDPAYGIGARFQIGSFAIRGEFEYFDIDVDADLNMLSVGLTYTF